MAPAVEHEPPAENPRIGPEAALPESLGEDHDLVVARLLFAGREGPAEDRLDREDGEEVAKAFDPLTGKEVWSWKNDHPMLSSLLTTAGGLVFAGKPTGEFVSFDARSGELLWQFQTGSGIHSNPITYAVNGKQYVAVPTGWGGWVEGYAPELYGAPRGSALFVFALP